MKKIILPGHAGRNKKSIFHFSARGAKKILFLLTLILFFWTNVYALSVDEAQGYVGKLCYIKYNPFKYSDIDINKKIIGKIIGLINDNDYEFIIFTTAGLEYIKIDKIKDIQILGGV